MFSYAAPTFPPAVQRRIPFLGMRVRLAFGCGAAVMAIYRMTGLSAA
jgi:hypothetical protein